MIVFIVIILMILLIALSPYIDRSNNRIILWYNTFKGTRKFIIIK